MAPVYETDIEGGIQLPEYNFNPPSVVEVLGRLQSVGIEAAREGEDRIVEPLVVDGSPCVVGDDSGDEEDDAR